MRRIRSLVAWARRTRPWRTWMRFLDGRGLVLARGLAFQAVLAVFAALWLAFAALGGWLRSNTTTRNAIVEWVNTAVPGLIDVGEGGAVDLEALLSVSALGWTGVVAGAVLLWTTVSWFSSGREAVRAIAGLPRRPGNAVLLRLRDALVALAFVAAILVSATLTIVGSSAVDVVLGWLGVDQTAVESVLTGAGSIAIGFAIDTTLTFLFLRFLAGLPSGFWTTLKASLIGAAAFGVLKAAAGLIVGHTSSNPLLASFTVVLGLLFWFYLLCAVLLIVAAWATEGARTPEERERWSDAERAAADESATARP